MAISQTELISLLHAIGVEIDDRGHTICLRFSGKRAHLAKRPLEIPMPIKEVRQIIDGLELDKDILGKAIPDLYGKPSSPGKRKGDGRAGYVLLA